MNQNVVNLTPGYYPSVTAGRPLSSADIYVGIVDLDPEIIANQKQITVRQEDGTEVDVSQPITTSAGGVPLYDGSPVTLLVDGDYSLKVLDSSGAQIFYIPKALPTLDDNNYYIDPSEADHGVASASGDRTIQDFLTTIGTSTKATIVGRRDDTGNETEYLILTSLDASSYTNITWVWEEGAQIKPASGITLTLYSPDKVDVGKVQHWIDITNNPTDPVEFAESGTLYMKWWGAVGDGTTDDTEEIQACFTAAMTCAGSRGGIEIVATPGVYKCTSELTLDYSSGAHNITLRGVGSGYTYSQEYPPTQFFFDPPAPITNGFNCGTAGVDTARHLLIEDIYVNGNDEVTNGITFGFYNLLKRVTVSNCVVGILWDGAIQSQADEICCQYNGTGIRVVADSYSSTIWNIRNSNFRFNTSIGMDIKAGVHCSIVNCGIEKNDVYGVRFFRDVAQTNRIRISDSWFEQNGDATHAQLYFDSTIRATSGGGPPDEIDIISCMFNSNPLHVKVNSGRYITFEGCTFSGAADPSADRVYDPTYAQYIVERKFYGASPPTAGIGSQGYVWDMKRGGSDTRGGIYSTGGLWKTGGRTQTLWFYHEGAFTAGNAVVMKALYPYIAGETFPTCYIQPAKGSLVAIAAQAPNVFGAGSVTVIPVIFNFADGGGPVPFGTDELSGDGLFTGAATNWTLGAGWTYSTNDVDKDGDGTATLAHDNFAATIGETYYVFFTISGWSVGTVTASLGGVSGTAIGADGFYAQEFTASSTAGLAFTPTNTARFTIDAVYVNTTEGVTIGTTSYQNATTYTVFDNDAVFANKKSIGAVLIPSGTYAAGAEEQIVAGVTIEF